MVDDGLVIDVSPMKRITVDPLARTAVAGPGSPGRRPRHHPGTDLDNIPPAAVAADAVRYPVADARSGIASA
jgi:hypothetical protein